jgi:hypothetical protein
VVVNIDDCISFWHTQEIRKVSRNQDQREIMGVLGVTICLQQRSAKGEETIKDNIIFSTLLMDSLEPEIYLY